MDSKSLSHTRWKCQYYSVFIPLTGWQSEPLHPYKTVRIEVENVTQFDGMAFPFLL